MSRESEKLYDGITNIDDAIIERAQGAKPKRRRFYRKWMGPVAAVLAIAILTNVLLRGDLISSAYAVERAEYPNSAPHAADTSGYEGAHTFVAESVPVFLSGAAEGNRVYSPLSAYMALAMTAELTDGESRAQILSVLGENDVATLREHANVIWNQNYLDDETGKSILASSVWMDESIQYERDALQTLAANYYASSFSGKLGSRSVDRALQSWLNGQTHGMLAGKAAKESTASGTERDVLTLVSTVYFRGKWSSKFDKSATASGTFHAPDGERTCEFMRLKRMSGNYFWFEHFGAVAQNFTNGRCMWYILPDEGVTPEELLRDPELQAFLSSDPWEYEENHKDVYINLTVPKFDIEAETELSDGFRALGVTDIFDYTVSDFTPLTRDPSVEERGVWLSEAKQAARVLIDEDGCEATAYVKFNFGAGAGAPPEDEIDFTLDRPFLFTITNAWRDSGLPLFVGVVNQP